MLEAIPVLEKEVTSTVLVMAVRAVETWMTILPTHTTSLKSSVILSVSNWLSFRSDNRMDSYLLGSGTGRRGGGRIWLESNKIEVMGSLKANGEDGNTYGAGGSGGTIVLRAPMIVIDRTSLSALLFAYSQKTRPFGPTAAWETPSCSARTAGSSAAVAAVGFFSVTPFWNVETST